MDKNELKEKKEAAMLQLTAEESEIHEELGKIDSRLADYLIRLTFMNSTEAHNIWEILGGLRFVRISKTYPFNSGKAFCCFVVLNCDAKSAICSVFKNEDKQ